VMTKATIQVPGLKVAVPLAADALPRDLVLDGGSLTARAKINGKNYRKMLKQIAEQGAANIAIVLQGVLRPPPATGGQFMLEGAGFQVNVKTPLPDESGGEPPQG
jgi:hypothetical protein